MCTQLRGSDDAAHSMWRMDDIRPLKTLLFTPGPTPVPDAVLRVMAAPIIHHRTPQWQEQFGSVLERLPALFGTAGEVAMFSSSGSGAMESAVANLVRAGDEVVVASFGRFGARWADIAERYGATVHHHRTELGERPDPAAIGAFVAKHPDATVVFTTHSETATGAVSDAGAIGAAVRAAAGDDVLLVLDAISSLGAVEVQADAWGYDVVVTGSQKALMVPPGLAFASINARAYEYSQDVDTPRFYLDWRKALNAHRKSPASTPFTPALTIVLGLGAALDMIFDEGLERVYARHIALGRAVRAGVQALGLDLFSPDDDSSAVVTAVRVPDSLDDGTKIPGTLRRYGVTIAGGQDELKGKIFRLGHCGYVNQFDAVTCLAALERALVELGVDIPVGAGVAAAQASLVDSPVRS
jgi:aspartate aminotransferase-like enzyme